MLGLGLTDKQLLLYALIWNTTKNGSGLFKGTAPYIAEWLGCTDRNVKKIVRQLEDRGLIAHEVIRTMKKTYTIFWAIDPDKAKAPEKGSKAKIDWIGRTPKFPTEKETKFPTGREPEFPTDIVSIYSQGRNKKNCGGKKSARSRAKTTTTTGFLFENSEVTIPEALAADPCFTEWWGKLLRQPKWSEKTAEALEIELARLDLLDDPIQAAWSCMKAIERNWATIKDPAQLFCDDQEAAMAWIDAEIERRKAA